MGYRIRSGFEHLTVAELSREDKDDFAVRWCSLTERQERREAATAELIHDIHSSDRIERLTGNPMLLTTMALVKRSIGRLPQRRLELYEKAVEVLLNWRSLLGSAVDRREALPQLEYLAFSMCRDGVQQLREDEVLDLLHRVRREYPNIRPMMAHSPEQFLTMLEEHTGLLIQSGHVRHLGESLPVYEFRHLTIQEYLAGVALVQGHQPDRDPKKPLAQVVGQLIGRMARGSPVRAQDEETARGANWREAIRLCVSACNDDIIDDVMNAVLTPLTDESNGQAARAALAGLCLADEPNVSQSVAETVLDKLVANIAEDDERIDQMSIGAAIEEIGAGRWSSALMDRLYNAFFRGDSEHRLGPGSYAAAILVQRLPPSRAARQRWLRRQAELVASDNARTSIMAALVVMEAAWSHDSSVSSVHGDGLPPLPAALMQPFGLWVGLRTTGTGDPRLLP